MVLKPGVLSALQKRDTVMEGEGSADNIRAGGNLLSQTKAEDMTAPPIPRSTSKNPLTAGAVQT